MINQALHFVLTAGGFARRADELAKKHLPPNHSCPSYSSSQLQNFLGMVG
jgi:hypothetical protein